MIEKSMEVRAERGRPGWQAEDQGDHPVGKRGP